MGETEAEPVVCSLVYDLGNNLDRGLMRGKAFKFGTDTKSEVAEVIDTNEISNVG